MELLDEDQEVIVTEVPFGDGKMFVAELFIPHAGTFSGSGTTREKAEEAAVIRYKTWKDSNPLIPFITVPDDPPPEYQPDEEPAEDFPEQEPDEEYRKLLGKTRETLSEVNHGLHTYMMTAIPAESERFRELYILTRELHAITDTIRIFTEHEYKPFLGRKSRC